MQQTVQHLPRRLGATLAVVGFGADSDDWKVGKCWRKRDLRPHFLWLQRDMSSIYAFMAYHLRDESGSSHLQIADRQKAFQQALEFGRQPEGVHDQSRREVETRLAEIVRLDCLCSNQTQFKVPLGSSKAKERLPFEHAFHPEENMPESSY